MTMPTVFVTQNEGLTNSNLFDGGDEVNDLNILRLLAKRSYIISCYESVVESKNYSDAKDSDSSEFPESPGSPGYFQGAEDCQCYTENTTIGDEMNSYENIEKEKNNADKLNRLEYVKIPENYDYSQIKSMSLEAREKLKNIQPTSIAQASRISGVSPNDISVLLVYMGR